MSDHLRVLMVEDSEADAELILHELGRSGYHPIFMRVQSAAQMAKALLESEWDLILSDYQLPGFSGLDALHLYIQAGLDIPFIVISGAIGEDTAALLMKGGAHDYFLKDKLARLGPAVRRELAEASERKQRRLAEEQLRENEEQFRTIFELTPDAIFIVDEDGCMIEFNNTACKQLGYSRKEMLYLPLVEIVAPEYLERARSRIQKMDAEQGNYESCFIRKDGSRLPVDLSVRRIQYHGKPALLGAARDITERKRAEAQTQTYNRNLQLLNDLALELADLPPDRDIGKVITARLKQLTGAFITTYHEYDSQERCLRIRSLSIDGESSEQFQRLVGFRLEELVIPVSETLYRDMVNQTVYSTDSVPEVISGILPDAIGKDIQETLQVENILSMTFAYQYELLGSALIILKEGHLVTDDRLLRAFAHTVAVTLRRKKAELRLEDRVRDLDGLQKISNTLSSSLDLDQVIPFFLQTTAAMLGADGAALALYSAETDEVVFPPDYSYPAPQPEVGAANQKNMAWEVIHSRQPINLQSYASHPAARPKWVAYGLQAFICVPLLSGDECLGALGLYHTTTEKQFTAGDLSLVEAIGRQAALAIRNAQSFQKTQTATAEIMDAYDSTIKGWSKALELRDKETHGHAERVAEMSLILADKMNMKPQAREHFYRGVLLHDIGKMGMPDSILLKPGPLTEDEWVIMRKHVDYAAQLLSGIPFLKPAIDVPHYHHERWDGKGYPRGLKGEAIPIGARIFSVVDVWDALTSDRPYRPAWNTQEARRHIQQNAGSQFDPQVVAAFIQMLDEYFA